MRAPAQPADRNVQIECAAGHSSPGVTFEARLDAGAATLATCRLAPSGGEFVAFSRATVAIHQGRPIKLGWRDPAEDRVRSRNLPGGRAMLVDAGVPVWKRWPVTRSIFAFAIEDGFLRRQWETACEGRGMRAIRTEIDVDDPVVTYVCALGRVELAEGGSRGRLFAEGLASLLAIQLLRQHGEAPCRPAPHRGGLAPMRLKRVTDYIEAHLEYDIGLDALADVAGLSTHHFGQAFKIAIGQAPHRYVTERRVARARLLLAEPERPIAEIACATGFSSQSHLTTNFRRLTGATPAQFRRSLG